MRLKALLLAGAMAIAAPAAAQTTITADVGAHGLGTSVTQAGSTYAIDGGTRAGGNLFHSFGQFSLGSGATAQWVRAGGDAAAILNVINRVTGGQASQIAGVIDSTGLPNASFFFINPAGIVFTEGARVNVPGAAHFSTASSLRFADGARFAVAAPDGSTLTMAAPESFGFVGGEGAIGADGLGQGFAAPSTSLTFAAADVSLANSQISLGSLDLVAAGDGPLTVTLANPAAALASGLLTVENSQVNVAPAVGARGALRLNGGDVFLGGATLSQQSNSVAAGPFFVFADRILAQDSFLSATALGAADSPRIALAAADVSLVGTFVASSALGSGRAGGVFVSADVVELNGAFLSSTAAGAGAGGDVEISAGLVLTDGAFLTTRASGAGDAGDIVVSGTDIETVESFFTTGADGAGAPGDIFLLGDRIALFGGFFGSSPGEESNSGDVVAVAQESFEAFGTLLLTNTFSSGAAGSILVSAPEVFVTDSFISSTAFGTGDAGSVIFQGDTLIFDETQIEAEARGTSTQELGVVLLQATGDIILNLSSVASNAFGSADGGVLILDGGNVTLLDSQLQADSFGDGNAGLISVKAAEAITMTNGAISSDAVVTGNAGGVLLEAQTITLDVSASVSSDTFDEGDAGDVSITARELNVLDGARISSEAKSGTGNAGTVSIEADSIFVFGGAILSDTRAAGDAGQVSIATNELFVRSDRRNPTFISSDSLGSGNAGGVTIDARSISVLDGASISSDSFNDGDSGEVEITTQSLRVENGSFVSSDSLGAGDAGGVSIQTGSLTLRDEGSVSSNAFDAGNAGAVQIQAQSIVVEDGSFIASDASGSGDAGDVTIETGTLRVTGGAGPITYVSSDSLGAGDAGQVTIEARSIEVTDGAFISSDSYDFGDAGDVFLRTDNLLLRTGGNVSSETFGFGDAGNVLIEAGRITIEQEGAISSEARPGSLGNAGFVDILADSLTVRSDGRVSTSTTGLGDAGTVFIEAGDLVVDGGVISSAAQPDALGSSGQLFIAADTLSVTNGGSISTVSNNELPAGLIDIEAGSVRISGLGSGITSENLAADAGDAGSIFIASDDIRISEGGTISTNAMAGAAGGIDIAMSPVGFLTLEGASAPGSIQTSSGRDTGGQIRIGAPLAIISNGGSILALGDRRGANVVIESRYFVNSSDRQNIVAVDGEFELAAGLYDVSSGTVNRDLSVLDASKVLQGQCPVARSTGVLSQLVTRPVGPYARDPNFEPFRRPAERPAPRVGDCR